jgi:hypothetical protein
MPQELRDRYRRSTVSSVFKGLVLAEGEMVLQVDGGYGINRPIPRKVEAPEAIPDFVTLLCKSATGFVSFILV